MLGRVFGFLQGNFDAITRVSSHLYEGYLQDSWKVTRRFTVDYGIRLQHDKA